MSSVRNSLMCSEHLGRYSSIHGLHESISFANRYRIGQPLGSARMVPQDRRESDSHYTKVQQRCSSAIVRQRQFPARTFAEPLYLPIREIVARNRAYCGDRDVACVGIILTSVQSVAWYITIATTRRFLHRSPRQLCHVATRYERTAALIFARLT